MNAYQLIYQFLDDLTYEYPKISWMTDEDNQIVIWKEEE